MNFMKWHPVHTNVQEKGIEMLDNYVKRIYRYKVDFFYFMSKTPFY